MASIESSQALVFIQLTKSLKEARIVRPDSALNSCLHRVSRNGKNIGDDSCSDSTADPLFHSYLLPLVLNPLFALFKEVKLKRRERSCPAQMGQIAPKRPSPALNSIQVPNRASDCHLAYFLIDHSDGRQTHQWSDHRSRDRPCHCSGPKAVVGCHLM